MYIYVCFPTRYYECDVSPQHVIYSVKPSYISANLRKLAISSGLKFAYLILLLVCGIMKVIFKLYIFSGTFDKRENMYSAKISTFTVFGALLITSGY